MADQAGDKTEQATAQKLRRAREQGSVARSSDLATAIGLLATLKLLTMLAPAWLPDFHALFALGFSMLADPGGGKDAWSVVLPGALKLAIKLVLPLGIVSACTVLSSLYPGGIVLNFELLLPRLSRLSPRQNLGKLLQSTHYAQFGLSLLKVIALIFVLWQLSRSSMARFLTLQSMTLTEAIRTGAGLLMDDILTLATVIAAFAILDLPYQKFVFMRGQRMTKQEVKEEHRSSEGRPEVKSRIRRMQRRFAQRKLARAVPTADVVITNPTHYAVAIRYDTRQADAPYVVAKGIDEMALTIRRIAREHSIEILDLPPLARAVYQTSQVNQKVPVALYRAIATVLTYVMQVRAHRAGTRRIAPRRLTSVEVPESISQAISP